MSRLAELRRPRQPFPKKTRATTSALAQSIAEADAYRQHFEQAWDFWAGIQFMSHESIESVANPGSTLGEAIGALIEKEVNRLLDPIATENGCASIHVGRPHPYKASEYTP